MPASTSNPKTDSANVDADLVQSIREKARAVRGRITEAAERAGRDPDAVTLVAVTKTFPIETVKAARAAGLRHFGENRVGELVTKARALPGVNAAAQADTDVEPADGVRWHLIGPLQRNKARDAAAHFDLLHTVGRLKLARRLQFMAEELGRTIPVLVQVNISREAQKHGVAPDDLHAFLTDLAEFPDLRVRGLMGMAEFADTDDELETVVRPQFRRLRELFESAPEARHLPMDVLSMGMSGDFEVAVEEGATHVRIGTALFGSR